MFIYSCPLQKQSTNLGAEKDTIINCCWLYAPSLARSCENSSQEFEKQKDYFQNLLFDSYGNETIANWMVNGIPTKPKKCDEILTAMGLVKPLFLNDFFNLQKFTDIDLDASKSIFYELYSINQELEKLQSTLTILDEKIINLEKKEAGKSDDIKNKETITEEKNTLRQKNNFNQELSTDEYIKIILEKRQTESTFSPSPEIIGKKQEVKAKIKTYHTIKRTLLHKQKQLILAQENLLEEKNEVINTLVKDFEAIKTKDKFEIYNQIKSLLKENGPVVFVAAAVSGIYTHKSAITGVLLAKDKNDNHEVFLIINDTMEKRQKALPLTEQIIHQFIKNTFSKFYRVPQQPRQHQLMNEEEILTLLNTGSLFYSSRSLRKDLLGSGHETIVSPTNHLGKLSAIEYNIGSTKMHGIEETESSSAALATNEERSISKNRKCTIL